MPRFNVALPTFHAGQTKIFRARAQRNVVRCGRRFGKTLMATTIAADGAAKGLEVGFFAPEYKQLREPYESLLWTLREVKTKSSKTDGVIRTMNDGRIDFWHLTDNITAGRGYSYDRVIIDEAGFTKDGQMLDVWERAIAPTMATRPRAQVWVLGTPRGINPENFFYKLCHEDSMGFKPHYAPSNENPEVSEEYLEAEKKRYHPLVFEQEYLAHFVDFRGVAFFSSEKLTVDGLPVPYPKSCDVVFAVIDTAVKTGSENDGTGVVYCAQSSLAGHPLIILDWDYVQIEGAFLENWIPSVFENLELLARDCGARMGSIGAYIEDAQSGSILLQQCAARNLPATALPQDLTAAGKDARAINASGPVYRSEVKWSEWAYNKTVTFKGSTQNHLLTQVYGFRIGDKDAARRSDDLADCFTYSVAISLGNEKGIG